MNAGVSGAVIQSMGKVPVKSGRKKEEAGTAFPELLAGLAAVSQFFGGEQRGEVNQGKQAEGALPDVLGQTRGREEPGQPRREGPPIPIGEERICFPFGEGRGRAGVTAAATEARLGEREAPAAGKHPGKSPNHGLAGAAGPGIQAEHRGLTDTRAKPVLPALETAITSGRTEEGAAVREGPVREASPKPGLETEIPVKEGPASERKAAKGDDGLIASSLKEAYHLSGREEPVKIKVAEPYYESKPEFARTLSGNIANELSKGGRSLEIRLEPGDLGSLLIKLQTDKEGIHIELHCTNEKTALLLDKNLAEIGTFLRTHTETPVTLQIRQEVQPQLLWNQNQGNSGGRNSRDGQEEKKRDDGIRDNEAADFMEKLRLGLEAL